MDHVEATTEKQPHLKKTRNRRPDFHLGCPLTNNRSSWCNAFCVPVGVIGTCGRIAPHAVRGRTQRAIDGYEARKKEEDR
jgi:hypothetical protein